MRLKITSVDKYGFCGRDHHPSQEDVGLTVFAYKMETHFMRADGSGDIEPLERPDVEAMRLVRAVIHKTDHHAPDDWGYFYTVYFCVTETGRRLELIDHEVVVVDKMYEFVREVRDETCPSGEPKDGERQLDILRDKASTLLHIKKEGDRA
jgi:hypothetical protein